MRERERERDLPVACWGGLGASEERREEKKEEVAEEAF